MSRKEIRSYMRKINEIFYSLQGEGYYTGVPSVFVRFSGCNLKCPFCDTDHSDGVMMSDDEIIAVVSAYPACHVVLTGGEPALWIDSLLVDRLHEAGRYVCIETNGTRVLPSNIDWVTCSPKDGADVVLKHIDETKVVFTGQDVEKYYSSDVAHHFLQPCSCSNTSEVVDYVMKHPHWRLSLQTHKIIDIR